MYHAKGDLRVAWDRFCENVREKKAIAYSEKKLLKKVWKHLQQIKNLGEGQVV